MTSSDDKSHNVKVQARLSHPVVHASGPTEVFLRVDVTGLGETGKRPPLDLAVVLDRSGSMQGEKLRYAKKAVDTLIDRLLPADHMALVAYDDVVDTVFARRKVDDALVMKTKAALIETGGCTNLSGGLVEGLQQLGQDKGELRRVFLLSDGLANQGVTDPDALADLVQQGVKKGGGVSTFGVGVDFNEELLRTLADVGGGNYYYIASPDDIPGIFMEELGELGDVVAQNVLLDFVPQGVEILGVLGFNSPNLPAQAGDVRAGAVRSIMLALAVPPSKEGEVVLGEVICRWTALDDALVPREEHITVSAVSSSDLKRFQEAVDEEVLRAAQLQLVADENQAASRAARAGDEAAFHAHLEKARTSLELLGDVDDPGVREQRYLTNELLSGGSERLLRDLDLQKRTHTSQYNRSRGRTSKWFEDEHNRTSDNK
ncbi:MAG: VWA domain-containing protein [Actinobacteria bacterium]|nr:VWA domain-containing protein [Actinomycetota bacterium]